MRRAARAVGASLAALLGLSAPAAVAATPPAAPAAAPPTSSPAVFHPFAPDDGADDVTVTLDALSHPAWDPADDLTIDLTITNQSDETLSGVLVQTGMQAHTPSYRTALAHFHDPTRGANTVVIDNEDVAADIAPGASQQVTLSLNSAEVPSASQWGARGLNVQVFAGQSPLAEVRTVMVWDPQAAGLATPITTVIPVGLSASETQSALSPAATEGPDATRLAAVLEAVNQPGVSLTADPAALALTETASAATEFAGQDEREFFRLPFADADLAALAHQRRTDLLDAATDTEQLGALQLDEAAEPLEEADLLTLPVGDQADEAWLEAASDRADRVILPESAAPAVDTQNFTAPATSGPELPGSSERALVADDRLSAALGGEVLTPPGASGEALQLDPLRARQYLLADSAIVNRERPSDPRPLVITAPREAIATGNLTPTALADTLQALADAPWLQPTTVSEIAELSEVDIERSPLPASQPAPGEVSAQEIRSAEQAAQSRDLLASITPDDAAATDTAASLALPLHIASAALRNQTATRTSILQDLNSQAETLAASLAPVPSSTLNLIARSAHLPIRIESELDTPVVVHVHLDPNDPRLRPDDDVEVTVPAGGSVTAQVPVTAIGSGDLRVAVYLTNADGEQVGSEATFAVRVRAGWETVGMAVFGTVVALLFIVGLIRRIRRGPRGPVGGDIEVAGDESEDR